nr:hypothetical protein BaRGS_020662 [Batillaria attramentaria]
MIDTQVNSRQRPDEGSIPDDASDIAYFGLVAFATRNKETETGQTLYVSKCQELANFYLGFNGWSSTIKRMEEDKDAVAHNPSEPPQIRFFCVVELSFPKQGVTTQGLGAWEEVYSRQDPSSKATAILKARKRSHQRAMEHAFSKVLLVVLGNGKVSVEINTTKRDTLTDMQVAILAEEQVLKVNELNEEPQPEDTDEFHMDGTQDLDDANLHILQELGDSFS